MDSEIQFGDMEQPRTQVQLRPDRNRHFAVAPVFSPRDRELPIFVDIDAMRDMEQHAQSDTRVELGGVLLGGQYEDEHGRPFIVITDSLRAQHYESTKGSFKFTHDTWEKITRERESFPPDLQMVGWYHTHPDWGVFLSSLDMFICDNFFNRPLDVALVIDPCRDDRGFFQWTGKTQERIRRTGGFFLTASRFRQEELQAYAAQLEGKLPMAHEPRYAGQANYPPIVVSNPQPAWQALAVLGMLSLQFCLLLLLMWRMIPPLNTETGVTPAIQQQLDQLAALRDREAQINAKLEVLEMVIRQGTNAPEGVLKSLADRTSQVEELRSSLRSQQSLTQELDKEVGTLKTSLADWQRRSKLHQTDADRLLERNRELVAKLEESQQKLADQQKKQETTAEGESWWSVVFANSKPLGFGALVGALMVGAIVAVAVRMKRLEDEKPAEQPAE